MTATVATKQPMTAHDGDLAAWAIEQAKLLRAGRFAEADIPHIAEEIEGLAWAEFDDFVKDVADLISQTLRYRVQTGFRSEHWRGLIQMERNIVARTLDRRPSFAARLGEALEDAYGLAKVDVVQKIGLMDFPETCPFGWDELISGRLES